MALIMDNATAQNPPMSRFDAEAKVDLRFQEKLSLWMVQQGVPTVGIALIEGGKLKEAKVFGALGNGVPAPVDTLFDVCSLAKPIAAIVALKLVSVGKWSLDEPLCHDWIDPDVKDDPRLQKLTTRLVLSHQTGFPNWRQTMPSGKLAFEFEPGAQFQYSGEGFVYMKRAMERKLGQPWKAIVDACLFSPLGLKQTRVVWDDTLDRSKFATPHEGAGHPLTPEFEREIGVTPHLATPCDDIEYYFSPAGSLITTIGDYGKFGVAVLKGTGLSEDVFNEMVTPQVALFETGSYGLGWVLVKGLSTGEYALVHFGDDAGLRTFVVLLPQSKRGVVVLTNGDNGGEIYKKVIVQSLDIGKELFDKFQRAGVLEH